MLILLDEETKNLINKRLSLNVIRTGAHSEFVNGEEKFFQYVDFIWIAQLSYEDGSCYVTVVHARDKESSRSIKCHLFAPHINKDYLVSLTIIGDKVKERLSNLNLSFYNMLSGSINKIKIQVESRHLYAYLLLNTGSQDSTQLALRDEIFNLIDWIAEKNNDSELGRFSRYYMSSGGM